MATMSNPLKSRILVQYGDWPYMLMTTSLSRIAWSEGQRNVLEIILILIIIILLLIIVLIIIV